MDGIQSPKTAALFHVPCKALFPAQRIAEHFRANRATMQALRNYVRENGPISLRYVAMIDEKGGLLFGSLTLQGVKNVGEPKENHGRLAETIENNWEAQVKKFKGGYIKFEFVNGEIKFSVYGFSTTFAGRGSGAGNDSWNKLVAGQLADLLARSAPTVNRDFREFPESDGERAWESFPPPPPVLDS